MVYNVKEINLLSDGEWGFDVVIDCSGVFIVIEEVIKWLRCGGKIFVFGCCLKGFLIKIDFYIVCIKEL